MKRDYIFKAALLAFFAMLSLQMKAEDVLIDGLYYSLDADKHTAVLTSVADNAITSLEIPSTVESDGISYNVTKISSGFGYCTKLQSLSIPATVTTMSTSLPSCTYETAPGWDLLFGHIVEFDPTGIEGLKSEIHVSDGHWYTLSGVCLDKEPVKAGVYIHKGKKVVIR